MAKQILAGGAMGEMFRAFDWASTSLGPWEDWPQSLRTAVNFMLEAAQPVYIGWGPEIISLYNDGYIPILGNKHPEALGKPHPQVWAEVWDEYSPHMDAIRAGRSQYWVDQPIKLASRMHRPVSWFTFSWTPLRDESNEVAGFMCVATETTERVLSERQLVELMDEGYCVVQIIFDADNSPVDFRFLKTNPAFEQQSGLRNPEGRTVLELIPGFEPHSIKTFGNVAVSRQPIRFVNQVRFLARWFDIYAFPFAGTMDRVGILFRDITERKQMEQQLLDADRCKDEFLAMLAHELRNPLAPITSAAELLNMASFNEERVRLASEIIRRQVRHMTGLVDDLLDVSRVTRGVVKLETKPVQIETAVRDAVEQVRPLMRTRRQRLIVDVKPVCMTVLGDDKRLVQVIANLLNNAAKYTPEGGCITVRTDQHEGHVLLDVIDDGIGIQAEMVTRVFDLFAQEKRTPDRSSGGLGLGLTLVKSLVELHGGSVSCQSPGVGKGSQFTVRLPCAEHGGPVAIQEDARHQSLPRPLFIMVVDDNLDAATLLGIVLQEQGHRVIVEAEPAKALERAETEIPDVFLLDIGLPGMDGYELARRLRAKPQLDHAKLIAITGYGQEEDIAQALAAGFSHHFTKPIDSSKLAALLATLGVSQSGSR